MATAKNKSPAKPKAAPQNTSARKPVEALATEAVKAASLATLQETGEQSDEKKAVPPAGADPVIKELIVTAKVDGFRRAGRAWSTSLQTVPADEFTEEQIEALLAEPMLDVVIAGE